MKILLAVDGSVYSDSAVEELAKRPWPPQSEVKVITAAETPVPVGMEPWVVSPDYFEELDKSVRKAAQAIIDSALLKLKTITDKNLKICRRGGKLGRRSHRHGFTRVGRLESTVAGLSIECRGPSCQVFRRNRAKSAQRKRQEIARRNYGDFITRSSYLPTALSPTIERKVSSLARTKI
jgi:hypothetical protein